MEMSKNPRIIAIKIFKTKGEPPISVQTTNCALDCGLMGDRFSTGGDRQLTLLDSSVRVHMNAAEVKGLCYKKYRENLTTENFDVTQKTPGDILLCGDVQLEISSAKKECFEECVLRQKNMECQLKNGGIYLKVKASGTIKIGDEIKSKL